MTEYSARERVMFAVADATGASLDRLVYLFGFKGPLARLLEAGADLGGLFRRERRNVAPVKEIEGDPE